jgi:HEAT repeat protein
MRRIIVMLCAMLVLAAPCLRAEDYTGVQAAAGGLRSADPQARLTALGRLTLLARDGNYRAALAMTPALQDADPRVLDQARQSFNTLTDPAWGVAVLAATSDRDAATRRQAMLALTVLHRYQKRGCLLIAPQLAALEDADPAVREAANWSLQQMHDDPCGRNYLIGLHREFGQGLRPKGLEGGYPREQLLVSLGWSEATNPVPQVLAGLKAANPPLQRWSAWLAGWMDQVEAIPALQKMLTDGNPLLRLGAAEGLGHIFDPAGVRPLVGALADADAGVRRQAVLALGDAGVYAVEYQRNEIDHYVDEATVAKAKAIEAALTGARAGVALRAALRDKDGAVRAAAARVLAGFPGQTNLVPVLLPLLKDADAPVRKATAQALEALTGQEFGEDAAQWQVWWDKQGK